MKTKVLYILFFALVANAYGQKGVRLGYIDMEYILSSVDEYQEANKQLEKKVLKWKTEVEDQKRTIARMREDLNAEKVLLTKELIEEREVEIDALESEMIQYQQDRFGPQGDMIRQRTQLAKPIQDQVFNALQDIAERRNYDFIFDKSADIVMLYSNKNHDISDMVLEAINRSRKKNERTKKEDSELEKFDEEATPVKEEKTEAQKASEEKKEEVLSDREKRKREIEAERQKRLQDLEARKKAYEARRKKILEERQKLRDSLRNETTKQTDSIN